MKHIVFFSGGITSWKVAKDLVNNFGKENVILLFADTLIEDEDLYRFMIDAQEKLFEVDLSLVRKTLGKIKRIEKDGVSVRKKVLKRASKINMKINKNFIWLIDGRTPFEIYEDHKYMGNSRIAMCSRVLKQEICRRYIKRRFKNHNEVTLYMGIDWTEVHRVESPKKNWLPYKVEFPLTREPYYSKDDLTLELKKDGIKIPRLYEFGFAHNNCGGFCCRAGQGHFKTLQEKLPDRFDYYAKKERVLSKKLNGATILTKVINGEKKPYSLDDLKKDNTIDRSDLGGCGCFVGDD